MSVNHTAFWDVCVEVSLHHVDDLREPRWRRCALTSLDLAPVGTNSVRPHQTRDPVPAQMRLCGRELCAEPGGTVVAELLVKPGGAGSRNLRPQWPETEDQSSRTRSETMQISRACSAQQRAVCARWRNTRLSRLSRYRRLPVAEQRPGPAIRGPWSGIPGWLRGVERSRPQAPSLPTAA
jgi:hypothetical protein